MNEMKTRAARSARALWAAVRRPPYVVPGHYYSPLTGPRDVARALAWEQAAPGVDLREGEQRDLAARAAGVLAEPPPGPRWSADRANTMFGPADAAVYRAMLRELRPQRIVEVGSGYSTAVALDEGHEVTCVELSPGRLRRLTRADDRVTLVREPVQQVPLNVYGTLGDGDVLFIDSTHVAKAGSDVCWLLLHVLPRLAPGVAVHVHDIFWPFEYHTAWLAERRDWNEAYLRHALLSGNAEWRIVLFASWLWQAHPELVPERLRDERPGSIWLRRV